MATVKEIIDANLNGHGHTIYEAAKNAGFDTALNEEGRLDIADACALVDHESAGGQNIFGCDAGGLWCNEEVTRERLDQLWDHINAGGNSNGVGLTQLTFPPLISRAEDRGGAHLPEHQCSVGFELLAELVDKLGYTLGIAAYNAGEGNPQLGIDNGYFDKIMAARERWKELLAGAEGEEEVAEPVTEPVPELAIERSETVAAAEAFSWPEANDPPDPDSDIYQLRHPTRYVWRPDVESWARWLVNNFNVWCNTYHEHPEGRGFEEASTDEDGTVWFIENTSLDVWGPDGRNDPLGLTVGWQIFRILMDYPDPPNIRWIIWQGTQYGAWNNWEGEFFADLNSFMGHADHIHVTYW